VQAQLSWGDADPNLARCVEQLQALERREAQLAEKWLRTDRSVPSELYDPVYQVCDA
jgi:hypothetical protein